MPHFFDRIDRQFREPECDAGCAFQRHDEKGCGDERGEGW